MPSADTQLLKGVLPLLVLRHLRDHETYGYELVLRLQAAGLHDIATGSVYPVLTRLEREGHLTSFLVPSTAGPARKYYAPTPAGLTALATSEAAWARLRDIVDAPHPTSSTTSPTVPPATDGDHR